MIFHTKSLLGSNKKNNNNKKKIENEEFYETSIVRP